MKVAICGYPPLAFKLVDSLKSIGVECTHFIEDFMTNYGEDGVTTLPPPLSPVEFFEFRRLVDAGKLDGLIIAEDSIFSARVVKLCKLYDIPKVGVMDFRFFSDLREIRYLESDKAFIPQLEANIIDNCNLNCKACTHFSNLFGEGEVYKIEDFTRDIKQIAANADVLVLYILGGEPLKLKNLDAYLRICKRYLPNTNLRLLTNGLLVPKVSQDILDSIRENDFKVEVSMYPPTVKIRDEIKAVFEKNNILYLFRGDVHAFDAFMSLRGGHDPEKSRNACNNDACRFLRNGKIYKCPTDALHFRFAERFGLKNLPSATGIDIFARNFSAQLEQLDGIVEFCHWCNETKRLIEWKPENNPQLTDWLADPSELEKLLPK